MISTPSMDLIMPLKILICGRIYNSDEIYELIEQAMNKIISLTSHTVFYFIEERTWKKIKAKFPKQQCLLTAQNDPPVSYVLTFGGDGTILYSAKIFMKSNPMFISFQKGTLGFLCKFSLSQMDSVLNNVISTRTLSEEDQLPFKIMKYMRIECSLKLSTIKKQQTFLCLNQVAITRDFKSRIILQIYVNDLFLTETGGDGLLISTPTGSTAYALSAGGPVIQNGVNCLTLVPIAPHSLSFRPICLHSSSTIKIKFSQKSNNHGYISFDGQTNKIFSLGDEVTIKQSHNSLVFYESKQEDAQLPDWNKRLKIFLNWNEPFKSGKEPLDNKQQQNVTNNFIDKYKPKL